jgi:hypothetical protein
MAKTENYIPRMNDSVLLKAKGFLKYVVVSVDIEKKTADLKTVSGGSLFVQRVPWSDLSFLDESENPLRL